MYIFATELLFITTKTNIMKIKITLLVLIISALSFNGCDKVKDVADVTFNANYTTDLNVTVSPDRNINGTFNESTTVNLTSNADVKKYLHLIKNWEIVGLSSEITNTSENFNLINATVSIASSDKNASWEFNNVAMTTGTHLSLDNTNGQWNTINQILSEKQTFTITFSGQTDIDNVQFTLHITVKTKVTANPLE